MTALGAIRRFWPRRPKELPAPPITDAELDPSRAPRRNDLAGAIGFTMPWSVMQFWMFGTTEHWHFQTDIDAYAITYSFDLERGVWIALVWSVIGTLFFYGMHRLIKPTARRRKGYQFTSRSKILTVAFAATIVGVFSSWAATRLFAPDLLIPAAIGLVSAAVGALIMSAAAAIVVDIPPQPYLARQNVVSTTPVS